MLCLLWYRVLSLLAAGLPIALNSVPRLHYLLAARQPRGILLCTPSPAGRSSGPPQPSLTPLARPALLTWEVGFGFAPFHLKGDTESTELQRNTVRYCRPLLLLSISRGSYIIYSGPLRTTVRYHRPPSAPLLVSPFPWEHHALPQVLSRLCHLETTRPPVVWVSAKLARSCHAICP